jgi:hypothetical protein
MCTCMLCMSCCAVRCTTSGTPVYALVRCLLSGVRYCQQACHMLETAQLGSVSYRQAASKPAFPAALTLALKLAITAGCSSVAPCCAALLMRGSSA